jgi:hypothetical protein
VQGMLDCHPSLAVIAPDMWCRCRFLTSMAAYMAGCRRFFAATVAEILHCCQFLSTVTALATICLILLSQQASAQSGLQLEGGTFFPYNVPMPLTISQTGEPDISLVAHYVSEPFVIPICWIWRIGLWSEGRSWELEVSHHKIYLENRPPEVGHFGISHGLNQIAVNRAWQFDQFVLRAGGGAILAHPESMVRGKTQPENGGIFGLGYYLTGPTVQVAIGRHFRLFDGFLATIEAKVSGYLASVPVADGDARVSGLFVQLTLMVGWRSK